MTTFSILHDDAYFLTCSLIDLFELYNIWMVEHTVKLGLSEGCLFLFRAKMADIDSFHDV